MNSAFTRKDMEDWFKLLGCRVKIDEIDDVEPFPKLIVRVPSRFYHFVRYTLAQRMAMGVLYEVENLGFWECRIEKYQFNWRKQ
jgi:hypothetical protein